MQPIKLTFFFFTLLILIGGMGQIGTDIYVPSLPAITHALSASHTAIQFSISSFMFGLGTSQLYYGPLSDHMGRRKPILIGILISLIGTVLCIFAFSPAVLIMGRFIQGVGLGAANSVGRIIIRDLISGKELAKAASEMGMIFTFMLACAPTVGGYIQHYLDWRMVFVFFLFYSLFVFFLTFYRLPETHPAPNTHIISWRSILKNFSILLKSPVFMGYTLCMTLTYASLIAYITAAPFLLENIAGLTAVQFGWLSFLTAGAVFVASFFNGRLVLTHGFFKIIHYGILTMISASLATIILGKLNFVTPTAIMAPIVLFFLGAGFTFSNVFAGALQPFPHLAGSGSALLGFLQILGATLGSALIAILHERNQIPLGLLFLILSCASWFALHYLAKQNKEQ